MIWAFTYAFHWLAPTQAARDIWLNLTYLGVVSTPSAMLVAALQFNQWHGWLRGRRAWLLAIQPLLTIILLWTDPYHGLFFGGKRILHQSLIYEGGPWFWFNVAYSYSLVLASILLLLYTAALRSRLYRMQTALILIGISFPIASNVIGFSGRNPFSGLDLTPIAFNFTGVLLALSLFRYRLLDLVPVGRDVLMEEMDEGMLMLDNQLRVIDFNPSARRLLDLPANPLLGVPAMCCLAHLPQLVSLIGQGGAENLELDFAGEARRCLLVKVRPILAKANTPAGVLIICHDITELKASEQRLVAANRQLCEQIQQIQELQASLKELAIRDPLTSLFNRRYLQETLARELSQAAREGQPLSLVMLDVDRFKELNDLYGHQAGDQVLLALSQALTALTRKGDIVSRFGGDEFLVALVNTPVDSAFQRVLDWQLSFSAGVIEYEGRRLGTTFSAGVATFPDHANACEQLIRLADVALYQSKASGGNCVLVSGAD